MLEWLFAPPRPRPHVSPALPTQRCRRRSAPGFPPSTCRYSNAPSGPFSCEPGFPRERGTSSLRGNLPWWYGASGAQTASSWQCFSLINHQHPHCFHVNASIPPRLPLHAAHYMRTQWLPSHVIGPSAPAHLPRHKPPDPGSPDGDLGIPSYEIVETGPGDAPTCK